LYELFPENNIELFPLDSSMYSPYGVQSPHYPTCEKHSVRIF